MDCPLGCGEIPASATADELFAMYDRTLRDIADQFAPERTVQSKLRPLSPWFDSRVPSAATVVGWSASTDVCVQIRIQTAGLAFGGTGLCSCRVRGVGGSCAKHLTAFNSYTY